MSETKQTISRILAGADKMTEMVNEMAAKIREMAPDLSNLALIGIQRRGVPLATRLREALAPDNPESISLGRLDITLYRDDLSTLGPQPIVGPTHLPFDVDDRTIVLVDDVLFTGRTVRAALEAVISWGRPRAVRLAVFVDRGHREIPIQADIVGMTIETTLDQIVEVQLLEIDPKERIVLVTAPREARES